MATTNETQWTTWQHVDEQNRPTDTGHRTVAGHRIIHNPVGGKCVEFPLGSGRLYSIDAYEATLRESVRDAAPAMAEALREAIVCAEAAGWQMLPRFDAALAAMRAALAKAEGR
jgi:hypothetical protein